MYTITETPVLGSFFRVLASIVLKLAGWKKEGALPDLKQFVVIAAHHTSNWDGLMIMLYVLAFGVRVKIAWLGKKELFRFPLGFFLKWMGGIPIDRSKKEDSVQHIAELFQKHEYLYLLVIPEGTRKRTEYWKTGFYYIAREAHVSIVCIYGDYNKKIAGVASVLDPSAQSIEEVFSSLQETYRGKTAKYPESVGPIRMKD